MENFKLNWNWNGGIFGLVIILSVFSVSSDSHAGGYKLQDQSTRAMGMIDAFTAAADDASAVYYNPAGLTNLERPEAIGNFYLSYRKIYYEGQGTEERSDTPLSYFPTLFVGSPAEIGGEKFFWGFGIYAPFGLGTEWDDDTAMSFTAEKGDIQLLNFNPTLAYKLTDRLSLGLGVDYFVSKATLAQRPGSGAMGVDIEGTGDGLGYNLGVQWELTDKIVLGASYRSSVEVDYDGDIDINPGGLEGDVKTTIEYPEVVALGVSWQTTPRLRFEFDAEWSEWSVNETQVIHHDIPAALLPPPLQSPMVQDRSWNDSWVYMLGVEYELNDKWTLRGGYGFNETPVPTATATPYLPAGDIHALAAGAGYHVSENLTLDMALIFAYGEDRTLSNDPSYAGDYEFASANCSLGLRYKF
ncbi:MAG: OmpP1/FadL family transporter [Verrucomicrobiota bacterium]